jgi:hypothetical protein
VYVQLIVFTLEYGVIFGQSKADFNRQGTFSLQSFRSGRKSARNDSIRHERIYGSVVDMTIVKFDSAMVAMREGVYSDYEYLLYDATGNANIVKGGYCICDNGYLRWPTMMAPSKVAVGDQDYNNCSRFCRTITIAGL